MSKFLENVWAVVGEERLRLPEEVFEIPVDTVLRIPVEGAPGSVGFMATADVWFAQYRELDRDQLERIVRLRDIELHRERQTSGFLRSELAAVERRLAEGQS